MSDLAKKLLDASNKSDGWDAWCLAPIAAEYIKELEEQRIKLLEALEFLVTAAGGEGMPYNLYAVEGELLQDCVDKARGAIAKAKGGDK